MIAQHKPLFCLGQTVATPAAFEALLASCESPAVFLDRHVRGDWGELCEEDREANNQAVIHGERILSAYQTKQGVKLWVITEANRSVTTFLLPDEY